ncbi:urea amidolyase related protein [Beutenbergia cavernae DSM 12333]|uniref:Urea amidolyase related protein n=1 Tax=Beutenbergia cavernae (strain ATCC BAA-8 / DSM 12333 / CCUG 43141 / JCM 11478 / NBRC 16432 / NCIMB 13614 / HKI 0122) TaxID=471853 RepID=C5C2F2_BEUC1|nr:biotin-dependent carboxyltransferase family protein [Beutenbergia cavernae]ACQ79638.1 urea amidolyase related protein [Beutenbergia cavernae DSM 12333]
MIEVLDAGGLTLVQDLGRPGLAALGVSPSGAADEAAHRRANVLAGNEPGAATLEVAFGGLVLRSDVVAYVAVCGAPCPVDVDGLAVAMEHVHALAPGQVLTLGVPGRGLRSYVAVGGGIDAAPVLGSRSRDTLAGLGPEPVRAGDRLPVGGQGSVATPPAHGVETAARSGAGPLDVVAGPHAELFAPDAFQRLLRSRYVVHADSDRVALRLDGPLLPRVAEVELPSEGLVRGAVQVPGDGRPIVFGPDHPLTGGYPVVAVLTRSASDAAAQLRPGDTVRFRS